MRRVRIFLLSIGLAAIASAQSLLPQNAPLLLNPPERRGLTAPRWAPDGRHLLVSGPKYQGLYLLSFPDGRFEVISEELTAGWGARWSHDGRYIAARVAQRQGQKILYQLALYDVANHERKTLTEWLPFLPGTPFWTKDDRWVYLSSTDRLRLFPLDKDKPTDQTKIAYVKNDYLYLYDTINKTEKQAGTTKILAVHPSPDHQHLAIEKMDGNLMVINLNGDDTLDVGIGCQPTWSPDGQFLCYSYAFDDGHQYYFSDLWVVSLDGNSHFKLTDLTADIEMNPSWSPDGKWIAYEVVNKGTIMAQAITISK